MSFLVGRIGRISALGVLVLLALSVIGARGLAPEVDWRLKVSQELLQLAESGSNESRVLIVLLQKNPETGRLRTQSIGSYRARSERALSTAYIESARIELTELGLPAAGNMTVRQTGAEIASTPTYLLYLNAFVLAVPVEAIPEIGSLPYVRELWDGQKEVRLPDDGLPGDAPRSSAALRPMGAGDPYEWEQLTARNWGFAAMGVQQADVPRNGWNGLRVSIIDRGFCETHPLLNWSVNGSTVFQDGKLNVYKKTYADQANNATVDDWENGHGTMVAGCVWQFAPNAKYHIHRMDWKWPWLSSYVQGIEHALQFEADVIVSAVGPIDPGCPCDTMDEVAVAASLAADSDTLVVHAAGNCAEDQSGDQYPVLPGCAAEVISVSSLEERLTGDHRIDESASPCSPCLVDGKPDLAAPGGDIITLGRIESDWTAEASGSSLAAPHLAGAALLLMDLANLESAPNSADLVREALFESAVDVMFSEGRDGKGRALVPGALAILKGNDTYPIPVVDLIDRTYDGSYSFRIQLQNNGEPSARSAGVFIRLEGGEFTSAGVGSFDLAKAYRQGPEGWEEPVDCPLGEAEVLEFYLDSGDEATSGYIEILPTSSSATVYYRAWILDSWDMVYNNQYLFQYESYVARDPEEWPRLLEGEGDDGTRNSTNPPFNRHTTDNAFSFVDYDAKSHDFVNDGTPPPAPIDLTPTPNRWTNFDRFWLDWTNPDHPWDIAGAWFKKGSPPTHSTDGTWVTSHPFFTMSGVEGSQEIYVWLEDAAGNRDHENRSHTTLRYDETPPSCSVSINNGDARTSSLVVTLNLDGCSDSDGSGLFQMRFSNDDSNWSSWEAYSISRTDWDLSTHGGNTNEGEKGVYVQLMDNAENVSAGSCSDGITYTTEHSVSTPSKPSGPTSGITGEELVFSAAGSTCSQGHTIRYQFDWGDGTQSDWIASSEAPHAYTSPGTYSVEARARCATNTSIGSSWSSGHTVIISQPVSGETVVVINPDTHRIVKFGYLSGSCDSLSYYSISYGDVSDRPCDDIMNPDCWSGVGEHADFIGTVLSDAGYDVRYMTPAEFAVTALNPVLVVIQDPLDTNMQQHPKSVETTLPNLLDMVDQQDFLDRLHSHIQDGKGTIFVGDAVQLLEDSPGAGEPRLSYGKTVVATSAGNALSQASDCVPGKWLFARGNPFCCYDREAVGTYTVEAGTLASAGSVIADLHILDSIDIPAAMTWSDTWYGPSDGTALLSVDVSGTGEYVLSGSTCNPPVYQVTVDSGTTHFMGYTSYEETLIHYIASDSFFDYRFRHHYPSNWHCSNQYMEMSFTVTQAGKQAIVALAQAAINQDVDTAAVFRISASGTVRADSTVHAAAFATDSADVAEWVGTSGLVEPGDVLALDPTCHGCYRLSANPCSTLVAGVVSSQPGVVLGEGTISGERALLALKGIVPVKVTDEGGPILLGDLLVTSSSPGHAMRWRGPGPCPCALVGKALEPMPDKSGMILVLLTAH